jgi:hypothetical protein
MPSQNFADLPGPKMDAEHEARGYNRAEREQTPLAATKMPASAFCKAGRGSENQRLPKRLGVGTLKLHQLLSSMSQAELKAALQARIESMDEHRLALVERVLLTLEAEELSAQLDASFDADRRAGRVTPERVSAAVAEARVARPYR